MIANKSGGLYIAHYKQKNSWSRLKLYDDQSQPSIVTSNTQRLILNDKVTALLGSATPPQVIPGAIIAERNHIHLSPVSHLFALSSVRKTKMEVCMGYFL